MSEHKDMKCDTNNCSNLRYGNDRTGLCRQCKIDKGMIKPNSFKNNGVVAMPRDVEVKLPDDVLDKMLRKFASFDQPAIIAGLVNVFCELAYEAKFKIVTAILEVEIIEGAIPEQALLNDRLDKLVEHVVQNNDISADLVEVVEANAVGITLDELRQRKGYASMH